MKFRKKPVVVEATQFFVKGPLVEGVHRTPNPASDESLNYWVETIHGQRAYLLDGDWVITEPDGVHHYPCKPDIFRATYERAG
jgi:hypothetical protein